MPFAPVLAAEAILSTAADISAESMSQMPLKIPAMPCATPLMAFPAMLKALTHASIMRPMFLNPLMITPITNLAALQRDLKLRMMACTPALTTMDWLYKRMNQLHTSRMPFTTATSAFLA